MVFIRFITVIFITIAICLVIAIPIILTKIVYEIWKNFNMQRYLCYKCKHCPIVKDPRKFENPYKCEIQRNSVDGVMRCTEFELRNIKKEIKNEEN